MSWDQEFAWSIVPTLLRGLVVTVQAVAGGMLLALVIGPSLAIAARSSRRLVAGGAAGLRELVRRTPLLVQVYFVFYGLPGAGITLSPLAAGVLCLGLHYGSYLSEVCRAGLESVARGQWEAAHALRLGPVATYRHVVLPQAIRPMLPAFANYLIAMFKDTPVLSAITVVELLQAAKLAGKESFRYLEPLTVAGLIYLFVGIGCSVAVRSLERKWTTVP